MVYNVYNYLIKGGKKKRHFQASGNNKQGRTRVVEVDKSLPDILADFVVIFI